MHVPLIWQMVLESNPDCKRYRLRKFMSCLVGSYIDYRNLSYQEQIERVDRLKEETIRMILKSSSDIAAFKEEVSGHLSNLRQAVEES